jgi:hypothetical protein
LFSPLNVSQVDDDSGSRQLCIGYYFRDDPQKVAVRIAAQHNLDVHRRTAIHHKLLELQQGAAARGIDVSPFPDGAGDAPTTKHIPVAFPLLSIRAKCECSFCFLFLLMLAARRRQSRLRCCLRAAVSAPSCLRRSPLPRATCPSPLTAEPPSAAAAGSLSSRRE